MSDFFERELLESKFRDVAFPSADMQIAISQDIAMHKRPDQDGARVEATGREPLTFTATIHFRNSIARGRNETWGTLYPDAWKAFLAAMSDRSSGTLVHPSFGYVLVKPVKCTTTLTGGKRDGEDVSAEWVEFSEDQDASNAIFAAASPIGTAVLNAIDLDEQVALLNLGGFDPDGGVPTFEDAMSTITAAIDTASLVGRKFLGLIDRIAYRCDRIELSIRSAADPQMWPARQAIIRLRAALLDLKAATVAKQKDVRFYVVPAPTTVGALAGKLQSTVSDLVKLNPFLARRAQIERAEVVRYYA